MKVGSTSVTTPTGEPDTTLLSSLAAQVAEARGRGTRVVVVSSGAVATGLAALGTAQRPTQIALLQAASAVGQPRVARSWQDALSAHGLLAGQVLLDPADLFSRRQYLLARATFTALLDQGVVPVVNENDAVADEELRFGDNDRLAALVAVLLGAAHLLLLTDTPGLFTADPARVEDATLIEEVTEIDRAVEAAAGPSTSGSGTGGMSSKLAAARLATWSGIETVVADARADGVLARLDAAGRVGGRRSSARGRARWRRARRGSRSPLRRAARSTSTRARTARFAAGRASCSRACAGTPASSTPATPSRSRATACSPPRGSRGARRPSSTPTPRAAPRRATWSSCTTTTSSCSTEPRRGPRYDSPMTDPVLAAQGADGAAASAIALRTATTEVKDAALRAAAQALVERTGAILAANLADVAAARAEGQPAALDRPPLARRAPGRPRWPTGLGAVAALPDPVGEIVEGWVRPNGLRVERVRVPLGVVGIVYENRPNVTSDAAGLCLKSGNAAFLRGSAGAIDVQPRDRGRAARGDRQGRACPKTRSSSSRTRAARPSSSSCGCAGVIDCSSPAAGRRSIAAGARARDGALRHRRRRQLPRLRRRGARTSTWPSAIVVNAKTPAPERLQRDGDARSCTRRRRRVPARGSPRRSPASSSSATTRRARVVGRARRGDRGGLRDRVPRPEAGGRRRRRRSTPRSRTSRATRRGTPRRS